MKRWMWLMLLVLLVLGGVLAYQLQPGIPVDVVAVRRGSISTYIEERARTRLPEIHRITMPLSGRIQPITLKEGDRVEAGTIVARLEADELQTRLSEASSRVEQFGQVVLSLKKVVAASQAQRDAREEKAKWARKEFDRILAGFEKGSITPSQKDAAELQKLESAYEFLKEQFNVQAMLAIQKATELARQDAVVQRDQKQRDFDRAVIRSKVSGTVLKRHVTNHRYLPAGEVLLEVGQLERLEIEADVLTQQAVQISDGRAGKPPSVVEIRGAAIGPQPVRGVVRQVFPQGFRKISSLGVEQQRVRVIIAFDPDVLRYNPQKNELPAIGNTGHRIGVGYRLRVRIFTRKRNNTLIVPRAAVFRNGRGGWECFVVREGIARRVTLTVGLMNDHEVEILQGVTEGDRVILAPESDLTDGTRVESR